jgi:Spy/CpxP family protein refolding chaperone
MKPTASHCLGIILLGFFALGGSLKAQDAPNSAGTTEQHHPHLMQQLGLSEAQKAQIKQIRQSAPKGKERRQAIMAVLTPEQKTQLKQDLEQKKAQQQQ